MMVILQTMNTCGITTSPTKKSNTIRGIIIEPKSGDAKYPWDNQTTEREHGESRVN